MEPGALAALVAIVAAFFSANDVDAVQLAGKAKCRYPKKRRA